MLDSGVVKVVEFGHSDIAAACAGWMLAAMGARVTRVNVTGNSVDERTNTPLAFALEALRDGKETAPDIENPTEFRKRLSAADVLLCSDLGALTSLATSPSQLRTSHPHLIIGIPTTFGLDGPYFGFFGTSLDAQALSGVAWVIGELGRSPLSLPAGILEHQSGALLAAGCLLALNVRDEYDEGQVVDVSLSDLLTSYVAGNCRFMIHHGLTWQRSGRRASGSGGAYPFVILPCADHVQLRRNGVASRLSR
jgi:crotonobetainyl-CoA:carnitine CoA-transferase CaiB-like acyl-CoA transferase